MLWIMAKKGRKIGRKIGRKKRYFVIQMETQIGLNKGFIDIVGSISRPSHAGNTGSIPVGTTNKIMALFIVCAFYLWRT
jgi:hypothetical protein